MPFRHIVVPSLNRALSNVVACPSSADPDSHQRGLDEYERFGGNCIHLHGEGGETHSRKTTGEWLRKRDRRNFFICAQICHEDWDDAAKKAIQRSTPDCIVEDIAMDLDLIGTDYLDFVYLANVPTQIEPVIEALGQHIKRGRIRSFGVRNWNAKNIEAANQFAARAKLPPIKGVVTNELAYLKTTRPLWPEDVSFSQLESTVRDGGLAVFAHADAFNRGQHLLDGSPISPRHAERWDHPANAQLVQRLHASALARGVTPLELDLGWLVNKLFHSLIMVSLPEMLHVGFDKFERASRMIMSGDELAAL